LGRVWPMRKCWVPGCLVALAHHVLTAFVSAAQDSSRSHPSVHRSTTLTTLIHSEPHSLLTDTAILSFQHSDIPLFHWSNLPLLSILSHLNCTKQIYCDPTDCPNQMAVRFSGLFEPKDCPRSEVRRMKRLPIKTSNHFATPPLTTSIVSHTLDSRLRQPVPTWTKIFKHE
jgi:hypothetical protein